MSARCNFCGRRFNNAQGVRAHLKSCGKYVTRGKLQKKAGRTVARRAVQQDPEWEDVSDDVIDSREPREPSDPLGGTVKRAEMHMAEWDLLRRLEKARGEESDRLWLELLALRRDRRKEYGF